ncbi:MAG: hypothetical protein U5J83_01200 [Bryobacterales bacterium]|nr:hypothetical protein [Bryobacterales bacterium]
MRFVFLLLTMAMAMLVGAEEVGFLPSQTCQLCHRLVPGTGGQGTRLGEAMAQVPGWKTSVMAFASKDPYWMAKAMAEKRAHPEAPFSVDSVCLRCHAPMQGDSRRKSGEAGGARRPERIGQRRRELHGLPPDFAGEFGKESVVHACQGNQRNRGWWRLAPTRSPLPCRCCTIPG